MDCPYGSVVNMPPGDWYIHVGTVVTGAGGVVDRVAPLGGFLKLFAPPTFCRTTMGCRPHLIQCEGLH